MRRICIFIQSEIALAVQVAQVWDRGWRHHQACEVGSVVALPANQEEAESLQEPSAKVLPGVHFLCLLGDINQLKESLLTSS